MFCLIYQNVFCFLAYLKHICAIVFVVLPGPVSLRLMLVADKSGLPAELYSTWIQSAPGSELEFKTSPWTLGYLPWVGAVSVCCNMSVQCLLHRLFYSQHCQTCYFKMEECQLTAHTNRSATMHKRARSSLGSKSELMHRKQKPFYFINSFTANSQYIGDVEWSRFTDSQFIGEVSKLVRPVKSLCVS